MKSTSLAPLLAACALAGCGEAETQPLDAQTVALTADANFRRVAVELAQAARFLADSKLLGGAFQGGCDDGPPAPATAFDDGSCDAADPAAAAEALADLLAARVFTEANVEQGETPLTFRLRPEVVCEAGDEDCRDMLESMPVRLRVTSADDGDLDITVLVGASRVETFELGLHAESLELQADLAGIKRALDIFGVPAAELPAQMDGRIALAISRHGPGDFTTSLSVIETLAVHGDTWGIDLDVALPAAALRLNERDREVTVNLGLGALALHGPLFGGADEACATFDDCVEPTPAAIVDLRLAGLTGSTTLEAGASADVLRASNLGLGNGPAVVEIDGVTVFTADLNPLAGRVFDLVATADDNGTTVEIEPSFDLALGYFLGSTPHDLGAPDWALDETLRIRLDGAAKPAIRIADEAPSLDGAARAVAEVIAGTLTLESSSQGSMQVEADMCLLAPPEAVDAHPFAGISAAACE